MSSLKYINCNICGADKTTLVAMQRGYRFVICVKCGLVYMNPRPDLEVLKSIYDTYHQRNGKDADSWDVLMKGNYRHVSGELVKKYPSGGRLLDIGCGYGHFLKIMEGRKWRAEGIDPSPNTVEHAGKEGLNVVRTTIDESLLPEHSYQAITMFYVLEHLTDPLKALNKVYRSLAPGGTAVIRVPHSTPVVRFLSIIKIDNNLYDAPFHLYDFSPISIVKLLEKSGFISIKVMPGEPTVPQPLLERVTSASFGYVAKGLYHISNGRILLPGISKTIFASKPGI